MMQKKTLTITISATGAIIAQAHGPGPGCADELASIQALLPDTVITDSRLTPAYYQQAESNQIHQYENEADTR
ncbi:MULTISPECIES: hypothetical protein [Glutamicibacter]|uniref:hypothetical protein n=1 Tax=Glutamicibacter TaxID=1742989 RepID=UPI000EB9CDD2|nr:hypothetical protein [Glutamicibacter sp.]HCJ54342.1 hypothetical protein [Glutamicibacter sp.]